MIKNLLSVLFIIFPLMFYYTFESAFIALFINPIWNFVLEPKFNLGLSYIHWFVGIWIIRMIFLDVFKTVATINRMIIKEENNNTYNPN